MGILGSNLKVVGNSGPPTYIKKMEGCQIDGITGNMDTLQPGGTYTQDFKTLGQVFLNDDVSGCCYYTFGETDTFVLQALNGETEVAGLIYHICVLADGHALQVRTESTDDAVRWDGVDDPDGIELLDSSYGDFIRLNSISGQAADTWEILAVRGNWTGIGV